MSDTVHDETDPVVEVLMEGRLRRQRIAMLAAMVGSALAITATVLFLAPASTTTEVVTASGTRVVTSAHEGAGLGWMAIVVGIAIAGAFVTFARAIRRRMPSPSALGTIADLSTIGRFAEALWHEDRYVQTEAEEALIGMLPRLKAGDAGLLNDRQKACLHRALKRPRRRREADLAVAIMRALTEIADARALPHISRLAEEPARGMHQETVRTCAVEVLPLLQQKVEAARLAQTLVRPAAAPDASGTLLRPAEAGPSGPVEQLVRPASPPQG
ncbi:MAG: hypothetical protein GX446_05100 [Chthonomonadales bacterium]|nr:hypothetical protein [Chthonomonadales bacterium]